MHGGRHPLPRHVEKSVPKLFVVGQPGKTHAFTRVSSPFVGYRTDEPGIWLRGCTYRRRVGSRIPGIADGSGTARKPPSDDSGSG
jgi:hypothetical protein